MKKTLIALAALAATGAAFAQSSVTLYGVADAAITKVTGSSTALRADSTGMTNGGPRWGIRGVEDLGGGLKAGFNFESGFSMRDGATGQSGGQTFSRAAFMTLEGGFGQLSMGRRFNPAFNTLTAWELTGAANYSAVANQFAAVTAGNRTSSQIMYTTPSLSGFVGQVGLRLKGNGSVSVVQNSANSFTATSTAEKAGYDVSLRYASGPLAVAFNVNNNNDVRTATSNTSAGASSAVATAPDAKTNKHLGASYNFGAFKIAGAIIDPVGDAKGFSIGGTTNVGPVALTLDFARDTNAKDTDFLLEAKYPLSKRTFAYAAYLKDGDKKAGGLGLDKTGFGLGVRHNF